MRYFFEVSYKGTNYAGFQIQKNANTIQAEVEKALKLFFRVEIPLTGSSRTDAGVHAFQNFFHGDYEKEIHPDSIYNLNAILPNDIVIKNILLMPDQAHCRFDAIFREYHYYIYTSKDPFMVERGYFYPFKLDYDALKQAANYVLTQQHFASFSKTNTQAKTDICYIESNEWIVEGENIIYRVKANRFLRGMVRALVATMLKVGTGKITVDKFKAIFTDPVFSMVDFAAPPHGLYLVHVNLPITNNNP